MTGELAGRLSGELFDECAGWIWEQLQEDGVYIAGELVELILTTERELAVHADPLERITAAVEGELGVRGVRTPDGPIDPRLIRMILEWEDEFLGYAGIKRAES